MDYLFLLAWIFLLLGLVLLALWFLLIWQPMNATKEQREEDLIYTKNFRQVRDQKNIEVMVEVLEEIGWPQIAMKMTAEEVARQLCNRLAVRLWNRPNVG